MPHTDHLKKLYRDLLDAWNRQDAAAYARLFRSTGSIVGFDGSVANGREEIEAHLRPIFTDHPTARYVGKVREVRTLGQSALVRAVAGMIPPGGGEIMPDRNAVQTVVASIDPDGGWSIEMFQNTPARFDGRPDEADRLTRELQAEVR